MGPSRLGSKCPICHHAPYCAHCLDRMDDTTASELCDYYDQGSHWEYDNVWGGPALLRRRRLHRKLRGVARTVGKLLLLHRSSVERLYAPGGAGYCEAERDFDACASKQIDAFQIFYRDLQGHHGTLDGVRSGDLVLVLLRRIAAKLGLSEASRLRLLHAGKQLEPTAACGLDPIV